VLSELYEQLHSQEVKSPDSNCYLYNRPIVLHISTNLQYSDLLTKTVDDGNNRDPHTVDFRYSLMRIFKPLHPHTPFTSQSCGFSRHFTTIRTHAHREAGSGPSNSHFSIIDESHRSVSCLLAVINALSSQRRYAFTIVGLVLASRRATTRLCLFLFAALQADLVMRRCKCLK